jgi:hypothetical protein
MCVFSLPTGHCEHPLATTGDAYQPDIARGETIFHNSPQAMISLLAVQTKSELVARCPTATHAIFI